MKYEYYNKAINILNTVFKEEEKNIDEAINLMVLSILNKKSIFSFGASHAGILSEEMFYRAGGLVVINPIFGQELMLNNSPITMTSKMERLVGYGEVLCARYDLKKDDLIIIHSVSGRNPVAIDIAKLAKELGLKIIVITNLQYSKSVTSRHESGKKLYEYADVIIDNHGDIGDACISLSGLKQKTGPTSTFVGSAIVNTIITESCKKLIEQGLSNPPIFYSANLDGGDELNKQIYREYQDVIHYKL